MSARAMLYLEEQQELSVELRELNTKHWVSLDLTIKEGYRRVAEFTLVSQTPEQEQILRMLAQAFQDNKATLEHLATV
jgi:predicted transcriptional regulator